LFVLISLYFLILAHSSPSTPVLLLHHISLTLQFFYSLAFLPPIISYLPIAVGNPYVFSHYFVKMSGRYATVLFSLVYLAGIVAAVYQLVLGTAAKAFPRWLSGWLSMRKQLGLIALMVSLQHFIVSCFMPIHGLLLDTGLKKTTMNKLNR
jgi:hypothetical protein